MTQVPLLFNINVKNTFIEDAFLEGCASGVDSTSTLKRHASEPELSTLPGATTYQINWCYGQNLSKADALDALVSSGKNRVDPSLAPTTADSLMLVEDVEGSDFDEESDCEDAETFSTVTDLEQQAWTTRRDLDDNSPLAATTLPRNMLPAPATQVALPVGPVFAQAKATYLPEWANDVMPPLEDMPCDFDFEDDDFDTFSEEDEPIGWQQTVTQPAVRPSFSHGAPKPTEWTNVSTVMLKNVPNKVTQSALVLELHHSGFQNTYDFLHIPMDLVTHVNRGYGFINFINPDMAFAFMMQFEGRKFDAFASGKVMSVVPAVIQGFEANYERYSNNTFKHRDASVAPLFLRKPEGWKPSAGGKKFVPKQRAAPSLIDLAAASMATKQNMKQQPRYQQHEPTTIGAAFAFKAMDTEASTQKQASASRPAVFCTSCGGSCLSSFKFCQFCGVKRATSAGQ